MKKGAKANKKKEPKVPDSHGNDSDSDGPPALIPLNVKKHHVPTPATRKHDKVDKADDDDDLPPLVPLKGHNHHHKDVVPSVKSQEKPAAQAPAKVVVAAPDTDDMSLASESNDDEDGEGSSYYGSEDDDLSDEEGDEEYYDDEEGEDGDEDEDDAEEDDTANLCQCPTCQRERERQEIETSRVLREREEAEQLLRERLRLESMPTGPGTRTVSYKKTPRHESQGSGNSSDAFVHNLVAMEGYANKSVEELRFEDYALDNPALKELKDILDAELEDRGKERKCREQMILNEAATRRWMPFAQTAWEHYLKGKNIYESSAGSKETAGELFTSALKACATGEHARHCYYLRAKCSMSVRPRNSINDLTECVKIDKYNAEAHYLLGVLVMNTQALWEVAEGHLLTALALNTAMFEKEEYSANLEKAREKATEARMIEQAELKKTAGNAALQRQCYAEAERLYTTAITLTPTSDKSHIYFCNRATARCEMGLQQETKRDTQCELFMSAVADCDESLKLKPDYTKALFRRALCLGEACFLRAELEEALKAFTAAAELDSENKLVSQGLRKTKIAIQSIDAKRKADEAEKLIAEREMQRALEKENERKALEEMRLEQERLRREKAEKQKAETEARAKAKLEREASAKDNAVAIAEEKRLKLEQAKLEKEAAKASKLQDKEAEREAKKIAKEQAKEKERADKLLREKEEKDAEEAARKKTEDFNREMIRVAAVMATTTGNSSAASSHMAAASLLTAAKSRDVSVPGLTSTSQPSAQTKGAAGATTSPASASVTAPSNIPAAPTRKSGSVLSMIASSVESGAPRAPGIPKKGGAKGDASSGDVKETPPAAQNSYEIRTEQMEIDPAKVGAVIGAKGVIINEIMKRSGAKIVVNQDFPGGSMQRIMMTGNAKQIGEARPLLVAVMTVGPHALTLPAILKEFQPGGSHEHVVAATVIGSSNANNAAKNKMPVANLLEAAFSASSAIAALDTASLSSQGAFPMLASKQRGAGVQASDVETSDEPVSADQAICIVCCDAIDGKNRLFTYGHCNHNSTCSMCMLRLRSIGAKDMGCPVCRASLPLVFTSLESTAKFEELHGAFVKGKDSAADFELHIESAMVFPKEHLRANVQRLFSHRCPRCLVDCKDRKRLQEHLLQTHLQRQCELCVQYKQVFPAEVASYTQVEYAAHLKGKGSDGGHPECSYCRTHYYSKSELYAHVSFEHRVCGICNDGDGNYKYYRDQQMLNVHHREKHFMCDEALCIANGAVYRSLFELQAHKREFHSSAKTHAAATALAPGPGGMSNEAFPSLGSAHNPLVHPSQSPALNAYGIVSDSGERSRASSNGQSFMYGGSGNGNSADDNDHANSRPKHLDRDVGSFYDSSESDFKMNSLLSGEGSGPSSVPARGLETGGSSGENSPHLPHGHNAYGSYNLPASSLAHTNGLLQGSLNFGDNFLLSAGIGEPMAIFGGGSSRNGLDADQENLPDFHLPLPAGMVMGAGIPSGYAGKGAGTVAGFAGLLGPDSEARVAQAQGRYGDQGGRSMGVGATDLGGAGMFGSYAESAGGATSASFLMSGAEDGLDFGSFRGIGLDLFSGSKNDYAEDASLPALDLGSWNELRSSTDGLPTSSGASVDDEFVSEESATGLNSVGSGSDCRIPVHDLPPDHFHELDEVSATNAAIIRATFAPEFIERLIGVLEAHPGGILGSAFPEAYRKMYGQRLILETKRGKKIKLLSVLEGHPNFFKSGMRVGGLKLHYQPGGAASHSQPAHGASLPASQGLADLHVGHAKGSAPYASSSSAGATTATGLAASGGLGNLKSAAGAQPSQPQPQPQSYSSLPPQGQAAEPFEPGLEVDLLGPEAFPNLAWLAAFDMHMYRWAGDDREWTEYALRIRPDLLSCLTEAGSGGSGGSLSVIAQVAQESGCDVSVQVERLNGVMEHFLVLVRGSSGMPANAAFAVAIDKVNSSLVELGLELEEGDDFAGSADEDSEFNPQQHARAGGGAAASAAARTHSYDSGRVQTVLDIPHSTVPLIRGKNGKKLNLIRKKSGAFVSLLTMVKGRGPAKLSISGSVQSVNMAVRLVKEIIAVGGGGAF